MTFTEKQVAQLLKPIAAQRVLRDGKGHSHVSQQDITAHLIRVFGFGAFDTDVVQVECVFERARMDKGAPTGRFDVCYRALIRLTVRDEHGREVCHYEDGSTALAQNQTLGDAHDLAYKSALSLAKKRAAINLGDQFGLSLYNKGQMTALVRGTLVGGEPVGDVEDGVEQQVSLGNDEIDAEPTVDPDPFSQRITAAGSTVELARVADEVALAHLDDADRERLRAEYTQRVHELTGAAA